MLMALMLAHGSLFKGLESVHADSSTTSTARRMMFCHCHFLVLDRTQYSELEQVSESEHTTTPMQF